MDATRTISAFNTATASENKIHDDVVASRFGFTGGLVPGVDVFAYLAHMPMARWGKAWLAGGAMRARFLKPIYDGDAAVVTAKDDGDGLALAISARGNICATGSAQLKGNPAPASRIDAARMPSASERPPASPVSLSLGLVLGTRREVYTREEGIAHIEAVRDDPKLYDDGRLANAAWLLRRANYVLADNVRLGPWIHVESEISLHSLLGDGEELETRAVVSENVDTKGHLMVVLDVEMSCLNRLIMTCRHWAIYEPRQVRQAAAS